jgi:histidine triad (HIT) family protein
MNRCIFCEIRDGNCPAFIVWEDEDFLAFLDINPINPCHIDIIPKKHVEYLFDLDEKLYSQLFSIARQLAGPLKTATQAKKIGIAVEGFGVAHAHIHLVPLNRGMELDPNRAVRATDEELARMCEKIKKEILR